MTSEGKTSTMVEVKRLSVGEIAERTGVSASALRFYEDHYLLHPERTAAGHRRYPAEAIRRVSFIRTAQRVGVSLADIREALNSLPGSRTPTAKDWARLAAEWKPMLDERIAVLTRLRDDLDGCIGCGCLSMKTCAIWNPDDVAATLGDGPRYLLADERPEAVG